MRYHCLCKVHALLFKSRILTQAEVDQNISALSFTDYKYNIHWILNLIQEMQQIYFINSTSLVNNSKPKTWDFQQGFLLLGPP